MERLQERLKMAEKALIRFEEVMAIVQSTFVERDAAIYRFELACETVWKAAKQMIFEIEGTDVGSPKGVIRSCREVGLFNEAETISALRMVDDRNLTLHTYNEPLAEEIFGWLQQHLPQLRQWLSRIREKIEHNS